MATMIEKMRQARMDRIEIRDLEPDWTRWAKCPVTECKTVIHGCCATHVQDHMVQHVRLHG